MNTIEILSEMNIHINEATANWFDFFSENKRITTVDIFPKIIHDKRKYQSVEIFYQKVLDRNIKKSDFKLIEKRFVDFITSLWLYNETYINILSSEINNNYYYKKNKKFLKKHLKVNIEHLCNKDEFLLIDNKNTLFSFSILATRDISPIIFYFKNSKILLLLNGCLALIYFGSFDDALLTKRIADNCSLYLHAAEYGQNNENKEIF